MVLAPISVINSRFEQQEQLNGHLRQWLQFHVLTYEVHEANAYREQGHICGVGLQISSILDGR